MSERTDALQRLRGAHEAAVLGELRRSGALSRSELMKRVGLSRTTLFRIVSDLLERKAVVEQPTPQDGPRRNGRPPLEIALNAHGAELIGIDLRRDQIQVVIANCAHEFVGRYSAPLSRAGEPEQAAAQAVAAVEELVRRESISLAPLQAIGLGLVGFVRDPASQVPHDMTPFAGQIAAALGERFGAPVRTDNNARLAALAEATWGAGRGLRNIVYLRWAHGVGGGLVVDGRLVHGAHGTAGEIGHTSCDPEGPPCHCGGRGCLEGAVSVPALLGACAARGAAVADADELTARAAEGDPVAVEVVREAAVTVGRTLAALAGHLDPECILIDAEPAALGGLVLDHVAEQVAALSLPAAARTIAVRPATLGADAAARGGVALLLHTASTAGGDPAGGGDPASAAAAAGQWAVPGC